MELLSNEYFVVEHHWRSDDIGKHVTVGPPWPSTIFLTYISSARNMENFQNCRILEGTRQQSIYPVCVDQ